MHPPPLRVTPDAVSFIWTVCALEALKGFFTVRGLPLFCDTVEEVLTAWSDEVLPMDV